MRPWQTALVYTVAGMVFASITAIVWASNDPASLPLSSLALSFWIFFWPTAIAVNLAAGATPSTRLDVVAAYFAVFAGMAAFGLARNPELDWRGLASLWLLVDALPTALLVIFLARPLRAVGPLVFAVSVVAAAIAQLASGDDATPATRIAVTLVVLGALGWPLLAAIGALHARKLVGDQSLVAASVWLVFAVVYALASNGAGPAQWAGGAAAFAGYGIVARGGHMAVRRGRRGTEPRRLLLLRSGAARPGSELLFDMLARHWLHVGGVARVASGATLSAGDLLELVHRRRVMNEGRYDPNPDPDGRFRVDVIPASAAVQCETLREVAAQCDVVLVDLRHFARARFQSAAELERVLDTIDLTRVVFVVAGRGDRSFLESMLTHGWSRLAADSPNQQPGVHAARLVSDPADSPAALRALLGILAS
jgi:hypothetical protein